MRSFQKLVIEEFGLFVSATRQPWVSEMRASGHGTHSTAPTCVRPFSVRRSMIRKCVFASTEGGWGVERGERVGSWSPGATNVHNVRPFAVRYRKDLQVWEKPPRTQSKSESVSDSNPLPSEKVHPKKSDHQRMCIYITHSWLLCVVCSFPCFSCI